MSVSRTAHLAKPFHHKMQSHILEDSIEKVYSSFMWIVKSYERWRRAFMRKYVVKISIALTLIMLIGLANSVFANEAIPNEDKVSDEDIFVAIEEFIKLDDNFFGYKVDQINISPQKHEFYDINNDVVAYGFNLTEQDHNEVIGYVITGTTYDFTPIIEAGKGALPLMSNNEAELVVKDKIAREKSAKKTKMLYNGPFACYANVELNDGETIIVDVKSKEVLPLDVKTDFIQKPKINKSEKKNNNYLWEKFTSKKIVKENIISKLNVFNTKVMATQPSPPTTGYIQIDFSLSSTFIQDQLGIYRNCGCGPSAGALLLWHLGDENSSYSELTNGMINDDWVPINIVQSAKELCGTDYMSPVFGTMVNEFINGINTYKQYESRNYTFSPSYKYKGTSLGSGQNTTSNTDVWAHLKTGISYRNAPVALGIGYPLSNGSSYYIEDNIPANFYFHWVVVSGFIDDRSGSLYNWYIKCKSWGDDYYASFNSMCYWRDSLASIYINVQY